MKIISLLQQMMIFAGFLELKNNIIMSITKLAHFIILVESRYLHEHIYMVTFTCI